jgi:phage gpG-like protein
MAGAGIQIGTSKGGSSLKVTGLEETLRDLRTMTKNAQDMSQIHASVALAVRGMQLRHFDRGEDSAGSRWKPLSALTMALRRGGGGKPLLDTGQLRASIGVQLTSGSGWQVGTRKIQAAVQQYGATIRPKHGKFLFIPLNMRGRGSKARSFASASREYEYQTKSGKTKRSYNKGKGRSATGNVAMIALTKAVIPAREYMYLNPQELEEMVELYASEVSARGTTYINWTGLRRRAAA